MKLFDLSLKLNGFPIKEARKALTSIQNIDETDFETYINQKKEEIVNHHLEHNSFYKSFAKNANPKDWNRIPVMTKRHLQQPLNHRLSEGFHIKNVHIHKTSGSSGDPFIFAKDKFCHALTWAVFQDRFSWLDIDLNTSKQARFYGIPLHKKGYYKERIKDALGNRFRFSVFDLSDKQLQKNLDKFKTTSFDYINGYTSAIVQFAKFLKNEHVILKHVCPSLKYCIVTSEILFETDKTLLETQLGIPVINEYGAAELGLIAFQNKHQEWIVNSEDLLVEILDDDGCILPYGEEGRVVITSLYNKSHPFIRYDLGDIAMLSKKSTPKKPILEKLIGRTNDIAELPSGKKAAGLTFYYITKSIIEDDGNVKEFVIEQHTRSKFKIKYTSDKALSSENKKHILTDIETYLEKGLSVEFEKLDQIERTKSGKLQQFKSFL
ncbi:phenylacetate--CoA ligase family protein [Yeosuana marina]|uniref:phenylacetate--CoA ligase family protein n=1 Tax=Yeosuana marina TaxID=1565536 RepID=UPI0014208EB6|nr:phenylacetate--CoA ligase family protein [Yeosuana marina]